MSRDIHTNTLTHKDADIQIYFITYMHTYIQTERQTDGHIYNKQT